MARMTNGLGNQNHLFLKKITTLFKVHSMKKVWAKVGKTGIIHQSLDRFLLTTITLQLPIHQLPTLFLA